MKTYIDQNATTAELCNNLDHKYAPFVYLNIEKYSRWAIVE